MYNNLYKVFFLLKAISFKQQIKIRRGILFVSVILNSCRYTISTRLPIFYYTILLFIQLYTDQRQYYIRQAAWVILRVMGV